MALVVIRLKQNRIAFWLVTLVCGVLLAAFASGPLLRGIGKFLIVEDPLDRAAAIIVLGGRTPFRELEAAKLYRAGWAPQIVIAGHVSSDETEALRQLRIKRPASWEIRREVLIQQGVPSSAILVLVGKRGGTLEELQAVYSSMALTDATVILVTSKYHTRRTRLTWIHVTSGHSQPIVRAASGDPFDPDHWWRHRRFALAVAREYLGLINYWTRFPVPP